MSRYLLILLLLTAPVQAATVYKWTDEQGRTHFTSEPPPKGFLSERIQVNRATSEPRKKAADPHAVDPDFDKLEAKAKKAQARADDSYRRRKCGEARQAKAQLASAVDAAAEDVQRQAAVSIAERDIRRWCD